MPTAAATCLRFCLSSLCMPACYRGNAVPAATHYHLHLLLHHTSWPRAPLLLSRWFASNATTFPVTPFMPHLLRWFLRPILPYRHLPLVPFFYFATTCLRANLHLRHHRCAVCRTCWSTIYLPLHRTFSFLLPYTAVQVPTCVLDLLPSILARRRRWMGGRDGGVMAWRRRAYVSSAAQATT